MAELLGPVSYGGGAPTRYRCTSCGVHGVKLWREYQTIARVTTLECATCAIKSQKKTGTVDENALWDDPTMPGRKTDQIGWRIPAVPTEDGSTFWGYSSVPGAAVVWWKRLPTSLAKEPAP